MKDLSIKLSADVKFVFCKVDKTRIIQILINLISNAIKFSHERSTVFVTLLTQKVSDRVLEVKIFVKDLGIGISEEDQNNLFKPYFRSTNANN